METKNIVRPGRRGIDRSQTYPRQYPCGWYRICDSDEITKRGQIKHAYILGREMVIFRSDDKHNQIYVLDAFCAHMGANLAFGGRVIPDTNCIQCPFHLWEYNGETGHCTKIPYIDGKIPEKCKVQTYPCVERHGMIMIWYHPLNESPHYDAICIDELLGNRFEFRGVYRYPNIHMHLQEFSENAADVQHFQPLHGKMCIPWTQLHIPHVFVHHQASLEFSTDKSYIVYFYDTAMLKLFGKIYESTKVDASITFYGPGGITLFRFDGKFGRVYLFHTHTPTNYTELDVEFRAYVEKKIPRLLSWYIVGNWIAQWYRDIIVWENKIFKRTPFLVKKDGPILKMRRWYNQFYLSKEELENFTDSLDCKTQYSFTTEEILYLNETWNILKTTGIVKFADDVLIRTINQNSSLRQFWTSKIIIDANNFDFGVGESCIRTDLSWHIGLREHSAHLILTLEKLLSSIHDKNLLSRQIQSLQFLQNISTLEHDSLIIFKICIIDIIRERFQIFTYDFTNDYEQAWDKFLSFILEYLAAKDHTIQAPMNNLISPIIIINQPSTHTSNS
ncbi:unnamed protein product [Rotaria sordida]|uniref:cholesterol 7-desaturase n=1 Tax=Rotaria sordida TaxID=392033 RepID=A0A818QSY6_9BILA|nr:unnamed protein product [Rotaria sordida]CAF0869165.1 unnamed protein product [Rotaria sordida]CAF3603804.1 unnamed protein product [Rotaria sordida]CAF3641492.1 unnamed protein product [Rotaria sordida]